MAQDQQRTASPETTQTTERSNLLDNKEPKNKDSKNSNAVVEFWSDTVKPFFSDHKVPIAIGLSGALAGTYFLLELLNVINPSVLSLLAGTGHLSIASAFGLAILMITLTAIGFNYAFNDKALFGEFGRVKSTHNFHNNSILEKAIKEDKKAEKINEIITRFINVKINIVSVSEESKEISNQLSFGNALNATFDGGFNDNHFTRLLNTAKVREVDLNSLKEQYTKALEGDGDANGDAKNQARKNLNEAEICNFVRSILLQINDTNMVELAEDKKSINIKNNDFVKELFENLSAKTETRPETRPETRSETETPTVR